MVADAYCNNGNVELSQPGIESTICTDGYQNVGDACEIIAYESCPAQTITHGDFRSQFSFLQQDHLESQTSSNSFEASSSEFPDQIDFGTYQVDESLTRSCADGVSEYSN